MKITRLALLGLTLIVLAGNFGQLKQTAMAQTAEIPFEITIEFYELGGFYIYADPELDETQLPAVIRYVSDEADGEDEGEVVLQWDRVFSAWVVSWYTNPPYFSKELNFIGGDGWKLVLGEGMDGWKIFGEAKIAKPEQVYIPLAMAGYDTGPLPLDFDGVFWWGQLQPAGQTRLGELPQPQRNVNLGQLTLWLAETVHCYDAEGVDMHNVVLNAFLSQYNSGGICVSWPE